MGKFLGAIALAAIGATAAQAGCSLGKIVTFDVTMHGYRPEVLAKINGQPARFLVDSGAWFSVITPGAAAEAHLRLEMIAPGAYMSGIGGKTEMNGTTVKAFTVAGVDIPNLPFIVGGSEVVGTAGVLGQNFLHLGDVEYDLPHGAISLVRAKDCGSKTGLAYWLTPGGVFSMLSLQDAGNRLGHTVAEILVNGQRVRATFDTGASATWISLRAAARLGIKPDSPGVMPAGHTSGIGTKMVPEWTVPVADITMDGERIHNSRIRMVDMSDADADMLIGVDFFLTHHVYVANSQHRLYFSYVGGSFFRDQPGGAVRAVDAQGKALELKDTTAEPSDAEGYGRRGMAALAKGHYETALDNLDKALILAPDSMHLLVQRASIHIAMNQRASAESDLDKAVTLKPDDDDARLARAAFHAETGQPKRALADVEAISHRIERVSDKRYALAQILMDADEPAKAIAELDSWIPTHGVDNRLGLALNTRCWARALLGRDLAKALADCTLALRNIPRKELAFDSRGLVRLRMGDAAGAVKDYDAALALYPRIAWSLYGRGLAKLQLGQKPDGERDIAAARAIRANIADEAKRWGMKP